MSTAIFILKSIQDATEYDNREKMRDLYTNTAAFFIEEGAVSVATSLDITFNKQVITVLYISVLLKDKTPLALYLVPKHDGRIEDDQERTHDVLYWNDDKDQKKSNLVSLTQLYNEKPHLFPILIPDLLPVQHHEKLPDGHCWEIKTSWKLNTNDGGTLKIRNKTDKPVDSLAREPALRLLKVFDKERCMFYFMQPEYYAAAAFGLEM
jgi:hypothetical protein